MWSVKELINNSNYCHIFIFSFIKKRTSFKMTKIECSIYSPLITKMECSVSPKSRRVAVLTGFMEFTEPITELMGNIAISFKNSKNIYSPWLNETFNYCKEVKNPHMSFTGIIQQVVHKLDPLFLKECPLFNNFGSKNMTVDSSMLDPYPIWAIPSRHIKLHVVGWF